MTVITFMFQLLCRWYRQVAPIITKKQTFRNEFHCGGLLFVLVCATHFPIARRYFRV